MPGVLLFLGLSTSLGDDHLRVYMAERLEWRGPVSNQALNALHAEAFRHDVVDHDWSSQVDHHSLGWVCAYDGQSQLVGFANVAWDGAKHAFLVDTAVAERARREGIGTRLVAAAAEHARAAGCEWLHVDFEEGELSQFYLQSCGFTPTAGGLIRLTLA